MKKGVLLTVFAILLIAITIGVVWYINKRDEFAHTPRNFFIPVNSAIIINIHEAATVPDKLGEIFSEEIEQYRKGLLGRLADTLAAYKYTDAGLRVFALREGTAKRMQTLSVLGNKRILSGNEIVSSVKQAFAGVDFFQRKFDEYKIYGLKSQADEVYFALEGGAILLSDSELYVEDALKQYESDRQSGKSRFQEVSRGVSVASGFNLFLNKDYFSGIFSSDLQLKRIFKYIDLSNTFQWAALDGELKEAGVFLHGFMGYKDAGASYVWTLDEQVPNEPLVDKVIPATAISFSVLTLSDISAYDAALDKYRNKVGRRATIQKRKQEYERYFGKKSAATLSDLLQGEFASVNTSYNSAKGEYEGAVVVALKSGGHCKMWLEEALVSYIAYKGGGSMSSYKSMYYVDRDKSFPYYKLPVEDLASVFWGELFEKNKSKYALVVDNYLVLASSERVVADFFKSHVRGNAVRDMDWYKSIRDNMSAKYTLGYFAEPGRQVAYFRDIVSGNLKKCLQKKDLSQFSSLAMQYSTEGNQLYAMMFLGTAELKASERPYLLWQTRLDAAMSMKPVAVTNHVSGEREFFVQDEKNTVYLINKEGRILWKQPIAGRINSEVYQVDVYKNGKLQYLFSTPTQIYLIDRNGNPVGRFPVALRAESKRGISVCDYEKNRNYRIFVPCADRNVYLYDLNGQLVSGWKSNKTDEEIVSRVKHFRVGGKDYIVYADRYRLYIMDRKGNPRVKVSQLFELSDNTEIYLSRQKGTDRLVFAGEKGRINRVDFSGQNDPLECPGLLESSRMNVADVDGDGREELIITSGGRLLVYDQAGKKIYERDFATESLDFPYVYRFSSKDIRIGLLDVAQHNMLLLNLKTGISRGFPITGDSPFSIVFTDQGRFHLYAGADGGSMIKYLVQF